jgi:hypothetical protein
MFKSPQIINSDFGLYRCFKFASNLLRDSLASPEGAVYKLDVLIHCFIKIRFNIVTDLLKALSYETRKPRC